MVMAGILVGGLVLLVIGAELLVRGASKLAAIAGISPLVIGLTVVAYGTSAPELAVSVHASLSGQPDVAVGNVVGSNIFNVLFVLGTCALILPLAVSRQLVRRDVPVMIGVSVLFLALAADGRVSRIDGMLLVAGAVAYTVHAVRSSRREQHGTPATQATRVGPLAGHPVAGRSAPRTRSARLHIALVVAGLAILVVGARMFVGGAVTLARALGISDLVVGLTIVAAGTSLPEVATSIVATLRGEREIAVGNVIGSSVFNILAILGVSSLVAPGGVPVAPSMIVFDIPVMIAVAAACLPIFVTGQRIARGEGALLLAFYIAYLLYLLLAASEHDALPAFSAAMLWFVLPITAVTLVVLGSRAAWPRTAPEGRETNA